MIKRFLALFAASACITACSSTEGPPAGSTPIAGGSGTMVGSAGVTGSSSGAGGLEAGSTGFAGSSGAGPSLAGAPSGGASGSAAGSPGAPVLTIPGAGKCSPPTLARASDASAAYDKWKADLVTSEGAGGFLRVRRPNSNAQINSTVSEGIAYGMLLAVYAGDQPTFDKL